MFVTKRFAKYSNRRYQDPTLQAVAWLISFMHVDGGGNGNSFVRKKIELRQLNREIGAFKMN